MVYLKCLRQRIKYNQRIIYAYDTMMMYFKGYLHIIEPTFLSSFMYTTHRVQHVFNYLHKEV
jgi:hypothetical protein